MNDIQQAIERYKKCVEFINKDLRCQDDELYRMDKLTRDEMELAKSDHILAISALEHQLTNGWIPVSLDVLPSKSTYYEVTVRDRMVGAKPRTTTLYYSKEKSKWFIPEDWEEKNEYGNHLLAWRENTEPYKEAL